MESAAFRLAETHAFCARFFALSTAGTLFVGPPGGTGVVTSEVGSGVDDKDGAAELDGLDVAAEVDGVKLQKISTAIPFTSILIIKFTINIEYIITLFKTLTL